MAPDPILHLRLEGKSEFGGFYPPRLPFNVSHEVVYSAARLTISGQAQGRVHETSLWVLSSNGNLVNSLWTEVPDEEPTTAGVSSRLSRLYPGSYQLELKSHDFTSTEDILVTIDLLELESTVAEVTRDVLQDAEFPGEESHPDLNTKAITFGISEASFTRFMTQFFTAPVFQVGMSPFLKLKLGIWNSSYPPWPFVHIDVDTKEFVISGELILSFSRWDDGPDAQPVATVSVRLIVNCEPVMVIGTEDTLQIQFRHAKILGKAPTPLVHNQDAIIGAYKSLTEFKEAVSGYLNQIISTQGDLGFVLPAYLASRPLPDHWDHVLNMDLHFKYFDYRTVNVHGFSVPYLFIVFSMQGRDLPPPCYCEEQSMFLPEANATSVSIDSLSNEGMHGQSRPQLYQPKPGAIKVAQNEVEPPRPEYYRLMTPAQVAAFGLSQRSFHEIARPYGNVGQDKSTSSGGNVYWSARFWYRTVLQAAKITSDGIEVNIDATAEGSAKAAVRAKCAGDVLSARARLRIRCEGNSIKWSLHVIQQGRELIIEAIPVAKVSDPNVTYEGVGDPPPPLDQVDDKIFSAVAKLFTASLNKQLSQKARIRLIQTVENNGEIKFFFVDDRYPSEEAAVVLGLLTPREI